MDLLRRDPSLGSAQNRAPAFNSGIPRPASAGQNTRKEARNMKKFVKQSFSLLLAVLMVLSLVPVNPVRAAADSASFTVNEAEDP